MINDMDEYLIAKNMVVYPPGYFEYQSQNFDFLNFEFLIYSIL